MIYRPWKRLRLVILASRRMRRRYRRRMEKMERGWRERHRLARIADRRAMDEEREKLHELLARMTTMSLGWEQRTPARELGLHVRWSQEMLMAYHRPDDSDKLKRYAIQELAATLEGELRTINFANIDEVEVTNWRDRRRAEHRWIG